MLLARTCAGDEQATARRSPLLCDELRRIAPSVREVAPVLQQALTTARENGALVRAWLARLLRPAGATGSLPTI